MVKIDQTTLEITNETDVYETVNNRYSQIATDYLNKTTKDSDCCAPDTSSDRVKLKIPTLGSDKKLIEYANPQEGDVVVDLGSGPGRDLLNMSNIIGPTGAGIGIDFSDEMLRLAKDHAEQLNISNVEFRKGNLTRIPVDENSTNLITSNCVINLIPNKMEVFKEAYRILKPGGRIVFSDIIAIDKIPELVSSNADAYCGCIGGAVTENEMTSLLEKAGFNDIEVHREYDFTKQTDGIDVKYGSTIFIGKK